MSKKIEMFGITIDELSMNEAVNVLKDWLLEEHRYCKYVVTPNVDHVVKLDTNQAFKKAYSDASMVLADGNPIVLSSKIFGMPLPETVPGSDLVPNIFNAFNVLNKPLTVYLLGAMLGVGEQAAINIQEKWPNVKVVGTLSPHFGFEKDDDYCSHICELIALSKADLLVIGLGAPKQELWVNKYQKKIPVKVALCVGATIDFLAGNVNRAPIWIRKLGLEWMHRMMSDPKRLVKRYVGDVIIFPRIFLKEWRKKKLTDL